MGVEDCGGRSALPCRAWHEGEVREFKARRIFDGLIENVTLFLQCDRVHADLSAYNVLYWDGRATIIDFPQAVDPWRNPSAFALFARDIERLCEYFARFGV